MNEFTTLIDASLSRLAPSATALAVLRPAIREIIDYSRGQRLVSENAPSDVISLLCRGMAKGFRTLPTAGQQTLALFVPGDLLDADAFLLGRASAAVVALTPARVATIAHADFRDAIRERPEIGWALMRSMARDRALLQEWLVGLGRRPALGRTAHLICEIAARLGDTTTAGDEAFVIPLSQVELADLLGLSSVHVNRVLQELHAEGLVDLTRGRLIIRNHARLIAFAGFDAAYLRDDS